MRQLALVVIAVTSIASLTGCLRRVVTPESSGPRQDPPRGMVEVTVVSDDEAQTWDVYAGDQRVCSTPCTQWFGARSPLFLTSAEGDELHLHNLGREAIDARRAVVVAEGHSEGKHVNGIVFTSLGGMFLVTGIALTAVGCSNMDELSGMCTAGLITSGVSAPLTAAAIWMLVDSPAKLHVLPVYKARASAKDTPVEVAVTPAGIAGRF